MASYFVWLRLKEVIKDLETLRTTLEDIPRQQKIKEILEDLRFVEKNITPKFKKCEQ